MQTCLQHVIGFVVDMPPKRQVVGLVLTRTHVPHDSRCRRQFVPSGGRSPGRVGSPPMTRLADVGGLGLAHELLERRPYRFREFPPGRFFLWVAGRIPVRGPHVDPPAARVLRRRTELVQRFPPPAVTTELLLLLGHPRLPCSRRKGAGRPGKRNGPSGGGASRLLGVSHIVPVTGLALAPSPRLTRSGARLPGGRRASSLAPLLMLRRKVYGTRRTQKRFKGSNDPVRWSWCQPSNSGRSCSDFPSVVRRTLK